MNIDRIFELHPPWPPMAVAAVWVPPRFIERLRPGLASGRVAWCLDVKRGRLPEIRAESRWLRECVEARWIKAQHQICDSLRHLLEHERGEPIPISLTEAVLGRDG